MKKLLLIPILTTLFVLTSGFTVNVHPGISTKKSATTTREHVEFEFQGTWESACTGDERLLSSKGTFDIQTTVNGNRMHALVRFNEHYEGTSATSDIQYVGHQTATFVDNIPITNGATSFVAITNVQLISKGTEPNEIAKIKTKFTVNANGEITVERVLFEVYCRG